MAGQCFLTLLLITNSIPIRNTLQSIPFVFCFQTMESIDAYSVEDVEGFHGDHLKINLKNLKDSKCYSFVHALFSRFHYSFVKNLLSLFCKYS